MFGFFNRGTKYEYENTRQYLRLPASWPIKCTTEAPSHTEQVSQTKDIGAGGVSLIVKEAVALGALIHLDILAPVLHRAIAVQGKVVRCTAIKQGFELGVRFVKIDPTDQEELNKAVEKALPPRQRNRQKQSWWRKIS